MNTLAVFFTTFLEFKWELELTILLAVSLFPVLFMFRILHNYYHFLAVKQKSEFTHRITKKKVSYLENIIENTHDIIFTIDSNRLILKFNNGAQGALQYTQEEVLGRPLSLIFIDEEKIEKMITTVDKHSAPFSDDELWVKTKERKELLLSVSVSVMNYSTREINGYVISAQDITEKKELELQLKEKNEELERLAITDGLTGLYNARYFQSMIQNALKRYHRFPQNPLSLIMIDIDSFKELNDTLGHQTGDVVLKKLADIIRNSLRVDLDTAYRYGGDEFVIILPDTTALNSHVVATRIQKGFSELEYTIPSLSIGITEADTDDSTSSFIKRADDAMYHSKKNGKNRITTR